MENNNNNTEIIDFQFPQPPTPQQKSSILNFTSSEQAYYNFPRKKERTKMIKNITSNTSCGVSKPKHHRKKPDPSAPKITMPCSECGKTFWSWKALFGHMRCHPERQWRGINPPKKNLITNRHCHHLEEDHEIATCLLMLANGDHDDNESRQGVHFGNFECSSCEKVFGSHQALGGHRASHKNVKGCFAINTNSEYEEREVVIGECSDVEKSDMEHKCSICFRVFSSGQALGGHKRCHWEKSVEQVSDFDLNIIPASIQFSQHYNNSIAAGLNLDLRLGI